MSLSCGLYSVQIGLLLELKESDVDLDVPFCIGHSEQHQEEDANYCEHNDYSYELWI